MNQLHFDNITPVRARRNDPKTSHDATKRSMQFAASHAGQILRALNSYGAMSPKQLFEFTGLSVVQIDRRRKEMIAAGLVRLKRLDDGAVAKHEGCEVWEAV
jgi:predicted HTH transcriptional regulator